MAARKTTTSKIPLTIKGGDEFKLIPNTTTGLGGGSRCVSNATYNNLHANSLISMRMLDGSHAGGTYNIYVRELVIKPKTRDDIKEEMSNFKDKIKELENCIEFMNETDSDVYDETEFKTYHVLKTLEDKGLSTIQRAKEIAKLVNA